MTPTLMTGCITEFGQRSSVSVGLLRLPWAEAATSQRFSLPTCFTGMHWINLLSQHKYLQVAAIPMTFLAGRPQKAPKEYSDCFQRARNYHPIQLPHDLLLCSSAEQLPEGFYPQEPTTILSAEELLTLANQGNFNSQHPSSWLGQGPPRMLLSGSFWCIIFLSQNKTKQSHFSPVLLSLFWPLYPSFVIYRLSLQ